MWLVIMIILIFSDTFPKCNASFHQCGTEKKRFEVSAHSIIFSVFNIHVYTRNSEAIMVGREERHGLDLRRQR